MHGGHQLVTYMGALHIAWKCVWEHLKKRSFVVSDIQFVTLAMQTAGKSSVSHQYIKG